MQPFYRKAGLFMPKKYKRQTNGGGTVYKLPGKRSRPWRALAPAIEDADYVYRRKTIGYYATRQEALD